MLTSVESKQHPTHSPHCYSSSSSPQKQKSSKFNLKIKSWETKMIGITQHHDHHHHRRPSSQSQTVAKVRLRFSFIKGCIADTAVFICTIHHHTTCMNYRAWYISQEKNSSKIIVDKDYIAKSKKNSFILIFVCCLIFIGQYASLSLSVLCDSAYYFIVHIRLSLLWRLFFFFTDNATFSPFSTILHCTLYYQNKFWERRALKDDETTAATVFSTI